MKRFGLRHRLPPDRLHEITGIRSGANRSLWYVGRLNLEERLAKMVRTKTSWGFPKWGSYGADRATATVRVCDYESCNDKADHPAPKSPLSDQKWWFCKHHAAEYNKNWNFFEGMTSEEAQAYARGDAHESSGYNTSGVYGWGGPSDADGLRAVERKAFATLGLEPDAKAKEIKASYRRLAKKYHPDTGAGEAAVKSFQAVLTAYEILKPRFEKPDRRS